MKKRILSVVFSMFIVCAVGIIGWCLWKVIPKMKEYHESSEAYDSIRESAVTSFGSDEEETASEAVSETEEPSATPVPSSVPVTSLPDFAMLDKIQGSAHYEASVPVEEQVRKYEDEEEYSYLPKEDTVTVDPASVRDAVHIDWDAFSGTDICAWFQMDSLSYPVMHTDNNDFYLHHLPDGSYNYGGSLFLYDKNDPMFTGQSSFIYGHNMNDGSMFGTLKNCLSEKYAGHVFYVYLPDGTRHTYQFYSVCLIPQTSQAYTWSFSDTAAFMNWQSFLREQSDFECGLLPDEHGRFVTLSTCNGMSGTNKRLIVVGKEVSVEKLQEPASWYDSYRDNYSDSVSDMRLSSDRIRDMLREMQDAVVKEASSLRYGS